MVLSRPVDSMLRRCYVIDIFAFFLVAMRHVHKEKTSPALLTAAIAVSCDIVCLLALGELAS